MSYFFKRSNDDKKLVINYENQLTKLGHKYTTDAGQKREYTDFSVIFPSSLRNYICPDGKSDIYFYKANDDTIHIVGVNPGSMYEYEKVNVVERNPNQFGIVLPKHLYNNLSNYHNFRYIFNPDEVEFVSGKQGIIVAEPF